MCKYDKFLKGFKEHVIISELLTGRPVDIEMLDASSIPKLGNESVSVGLCEKVIVVTIAGERTVYPITIQGSYSISNDEDECIKLHSLELFDNLRHVLYNIYPITYGDYMLLHETKDNQYIVVYDKSVRDQVTLENIFELAKCAIPIADVKEEYKKQEIAKINKTKSTEKYNSLIDELRIKEVSE